MRAGVLRVLGVLAVMHGINGAATASIVSNVPEIGPASISAGLAILAGGVLMLRARRK